MTTAFRSSKTTTEMQFLTKLLKVLLKFVKKGAMAGAFSRETCAKPSISKTTTEIEWNFFKVAVLKALNKKCSDQLLLLNTLYKALY